jgi:hypothetical protein
MIAALRPTLGFSSLKEPRQPVTHFPPRHVLQPTETIPDKIRYPPASRGANLAFLSTVLSLHLPDRAKLLVTSSTIIGSFLPLILQT